MCFCTLIGLIGVNRRFGDRQMACKTSLIIGLNVCTWVTGSVLQRA
jgi:hypothetical protein